MEHVVLLKFKEAVTLKQKDEVGKRIINLASEVEDVIDLAWGQPLAEGNDNEYDNVLVIRFPSEEALRIYNDHPNHLQVIEDCIKPFIEKLQIFDFASPRYTPKP